MALSITPTPVLKGEDADKFSEMIEDGLCHPVGLIPTPDINNALQMVREYVKECKSKAGTESDLMAGSC
ncbi:hypothetical protein QUF76_02115 [Desulfobacterales bacterium HSG16]|nr:hypothetical protein [Desulfobacterales bacterium HSG16]